MKEYKLNINGNEYAVSITDVQDDVAQVEVNGTNYSVKLDKPMRSTQVPKSAPTIRSVENTVQTPSVQVAKPASVNAESATAGSKVISPLPGVILEVSVSVGDTVTVGKKLIVLEAMKMENVINADRDGKITAIKVGKGDSVLQGDVLVIIG